MYSFFNTPRVILTCRGVAANFKLNDDWASTRTFQNRQVLVQLAVFSDFSKCKILCAFNPKPLQKRIYLKYHLFKSSAAYSATII